MLIQSHTSLRRTDLFSEVEGLVEREKYKSIQSEEEFVKSTDDLVVKFTNELKRRYNSSANYTLQTVYTCQRSLSREKCDALNA